MTRTKMAGAFVGLIVTLLALAACGSDNGSTVNEAVVAATPTVTKVAAAPTQPALTTSQKNAVRAAKNYVSFMHFSKRSLVMQLTDFDKFSDADATFAVNSLKINYNEQAAKAAQDYLDFTGFSRAGLIKQLQQFDHFTEAQATYAADKVGL